MDLHSEDSGKSGRGLFSHECLRNNAFFKGRDPRFLDKVIEAATVEVYCEGEVICKEGDFGDSMYFLHRGSVEILVGVDMERVAVLSDGNIFGEMSILGKEHKRSSTVRALEFCDCRVVHHRPFMSLLKRFPHEQEFFKEMANARSKELKQVETEVKKKNELEAPAPGHAMRRLSRRISAAMAVNRSFGTRRHSSVAPVTQPASPTRSLSPRLVSAQPPVHLNSVGELLACGEVTWNTKLAIVRSKLQAIAAFAKMGGGLSGAGASPVASPDISRLQTSQLDVAAPSSRRTSVAAIVGTLLGNRRKSQITKSNAGSRRTSNVNLMRMHAFSAADSRRGSQLIGVGQRKVVGLADPHVDIQEVGCESSDVAPPSKVPRRMSLNHAGKRSGSDLETDSVPIKKRSQSVAGFNSLMPDAQQPDASSAVLSFSLPPDMDTSGLTSFLSMPVPAIIEGNTPRGSMMDEPVNSATASSLVGHEDAQGPKALTDSGSSSERNSKDLAIEEFSNQLSASLAQAATEEQLAMLTDLASKIEHTDFDSDRNSEGSDISEADLVVDSRRGNARGSTLQLPDFSAMQSIGGFADPMFEGGFTPNRSISPMNQMIAQLKPQQKGRRGSRRKPLHSLQLGDRMQASTGRKLASRYDCTMWMPRRGVGVKAAACDSFAGATSKLAPYPAPELPPMLVRPLPAVTELSNEPWVFIGPSESTQTLGSPHLLLPSMPQRFAMYKGQKQRAKTPGSASTSRTSSTTRLGRCDSSGWFRGPQTRSQASSHESLPRARTAGSVGIGGLFASDSQTELPNRAIRSAGSIGFGSLFDTAEQQSSAPEVELRAQKSAEAPNSNRDNDDADGWHFIPACTSSARRNMPRPRQDGATSAHAMQDFRLKGERFLDADTSASTSATDLSGMPASWSFLSSSSGQLSLSLIESAVNGLPTAG